MSDSRASRGSGVDTLQTFGSGQDNLHFKVAGFCIKYKTRQSSCMNCQIWFIVHRKFKSWYNLCGWAGKVLCKSASKFDIHFAYDRISVYRKIEANSDGLRARKYFDPALLLLYLKERMKTAGIFPLDMTREGLAIILSVLYVLMIFRILIIN